MKPTNEQIADYLEHYNMWRRDKDDERPVPMPNPTEIGEMIDLAVERLRENKLK